MQAQVNISQRVAAMIGAFAISTLMLVGYFSPAASASLGVLA